MPPNKRPRHKHRRKLGNAPILRPLADQFALTVRGNITALELAPGTAAFDDLARCFNVIGIALSHRLDLIDQFRILQSAALTMEQIRTRSEALGRVAVAESEWLPILNAANAIELVLPRLDARQLYLAQQELMYG